MSFHEDTDPPPGRNVPKKSTSRVFIGLQILRTWADSSDGVRTQLDSSHVQTGMAGKKKPDQVQKGPGHRLTLTRVHFETTPENIPKSENIRKAV